MFLIDLNSVPNLKGNLEIFFSRQKLTNYRENQKIENDLKNLKLLCDYEECLNSEKEFIIVDEEFMDLIEEKNED